MNERKIAETINVRVNVGNFQHIEIVRYAEEKISYESDADRQTKEDSLHNDLVASVLRSMNKIPEDFRKDEKYVQKLEDSIGKSIPEWLEKDEVPNLASGQNVANYAKKEYNKKQAEIKDNKDNLESKGVMDDVVQDGDKDVKKEDAVVKDPETNPNNSSDEFFDEMIDDTPKESTEEVSFDDDDDLFGD
jgi:hypothetical protein